MEFKKIFMALSIGLLFAMAAFAQDVQLLTRTGLECPDIDKDIRECEAKGGNPSRYEDDDGCVRIKCETKYVAIGPLKVNARVIDSCPDFEEELKKCQEHGGNPSRYEDDDGCVRIRCEFEDECPDVQAQIDECRKIGGTISRRYDSNKCLIIDCHVSEKDCPTADEIDRLILSCKQMGLSYVTYAKDGCRHVECVKPVVCPGEAELERMRSDCALEGMNHQTYADQNGCRQIRCVNAPDCPTPQEIEEKILLCRQNGMGYKTIPIGMSASLAAAIQCYDIECVTVSDECPSVKDDIKACEDRGMDHEYYVDQNRCERARCVASEDPASQCPTQEKIKQMILRCEANGMGYEFYSYSPNPSLAAQQSPACRMVRCVLRACPSDAELQRHIQRCEQAGLEAQSYEGPDGCKNIRCSEYDCPPYEVTRELVAACRQKMLGIESYIDEDGCKSIRCAEPLEVEVIECKKAIRGDCVIISCSDGYTFDSCNPHDACPIIECKTFTDELGCVIRRCSDGSEYVRCPEKKPVECRIITRDDGCVAKVCTDNSEQVSCPGQQECEEYVLDDGCRVIECPDGSKKRICPDEPALECRVYVDEKGCEIKECTNGYLSSSCEKPPVCEETKDGECTVRICDDGSTQRICPSSEDVLCKSYSSLDGCTVTVCTDGFNDKLCPKSAQTHQMKETLPADLPAFPKVEAAQTGGWLSNLLRSIGL